MAHPTTAIWSPIRLSKACFGWHCMNLLHLKGNRNWEPSCGQNGRKWVRISPDLSLIVTRHYGVLLLYGQHLALNHLVAENHLRVVIGTNLLDQSTTDGNPKYVQDGIRLNLHCWHTSDRFSKFAFKLGQYNRSEMDQYRNDTTVRAYVRFTENVPFRVLYGYPFLGNENGTWVEVHDTRRNGCLWSYRSCSEDVREEAVLYWKPKMIALLISCFFTSYFVFYWMTNNQTNDVSLVTWSVSNAVCFGMPSECHYPMWFSGEINDDLYLRIPSAYLSLPPYLSLWIYICTCKQFSHWLDCRSHVACIINNKRKAFALHPFQFLFSAFVCCFLITSNEPCALSRRLINCCQSSRKKCPRACNSCFDKDLTFLSCMSRSSRFLLSFVSPRLLERELQRLSVNARLISFSLSSHRQFLTYFESWTC